MTDLSVCTQWLSRVQLPATPWTAAHQAPLSVGFPRQEYWSGLLFTSLGIFLTQGLSPCLLHWQAGSLLQNLLGKPGLDLAARSNFPRLSLLWCSWKNTV